MEKTRRDDQEEQRRHFQSWESFWGRPGYGAPRANTQKENLMKILHYPEIQKVNTAEARFIISPDALSG